MANDEAVKSGAGLRSRSELSSWANAVFRAKARGVISAGSIDYLTLLACSAMAVTFIAFFILMIKPLVLLRADILMWEETDFVSNIIKLNIGAPLYTDPADSNSLIYNPLAFLLTYAVAWPLGLTKSVVALRIIQLLYVVVAAVIATICCNKLRRLSFPEHAPGQSWTWTIFTFLAMFLAATAPYVNKFVYTLHVDALALLVSLISFWAMLRYLEKPNLGGLLLLSACPAIGFLTKQFLVGWIGVILIFLVLLDPKNLRRLLLFVSLSGTFSLLAFGLCYVLWGENFMFWTFDVMGGERKMITLSPDSYSISVVRGIDHVIRAWPEIFVGVVGGWLLMAWGNVRTVGPVFAGWVLLIASEGFSSGAGWNVLYHFGPGVLIGAVFMFAALPYLWAISREKSQASLAILHRWAHPVFMTATVLAIFMASHVVPSGDKTSPRYFRGIQSPTDIERYVAEIEQEFAGIETDKVLLGVGSWIYLRDDVLQKDRAVSLGDQPIGGIYENFEVTVGRLNSRVYEKVLVQDFHSPYFLYDWHDWPKPSGFREALTENYVELRMIQPPQGNDSLSAQILNAGPVSVFIRRN